MAPKVDDEGYVALPKRFSLLIVVAIIGQISGFIWYASKLDSRVDALEQADRRILDRGDERFAGVKARLDVLERDRDRIIKVETMISYVGDAVKRIEQKIDQRPP